MALTTRSATPNNLAGYGILHLRAGYVGAVKWTSDLIICTLKITITKQSEKLINEVASWQLPLKGAHQP